MVLGQVGIKSTELTSYLTPYTETNWKWVNHLLCFAQIWEGNIRVRITCG